MNIYDRIAAGEFKAALEVEFGLVGHKKADRLFELAWEHGHGSGMSDVAIFYDDFSSLVK